VLAAGRGAWWVGDGGRWGRGTWYGAVSLEVVKYLVEEAGADERCAGPDGTTALMLAVDAGHSDIAEYLRRQERAAEAAAALLEEEEREAAAKAASKGRRKKKKKGKQQGALPPEQAPASPLEGPSETTDDTQVRCLSRRL
jgi:hypothetical protein